MSGPLNVQIRPNAPIRVAVDQKAELTTLDTLADVDAYSPNDGDVLKYNSLTKTWISSPIITETDIDGGTF